VTERDGALAFEKQGEPPAEGKRRRA
jgi:hypothetical protein